MSAHSACIRAVRGEKEDGMKSFAPVDDGQMPDVTTPSCVRILGSSFGLPVFRS